MVPTLDTLLSLPLPVVALLVLALWGTVALVIHFKVVPWICGADGRRLGRFEAEVTSQIALAFGLLISFNAVWLWDRGDRVRAAVIDEAAALQTVLDEAEPLPGRAVIYAAVTAHARDVVEREWPLLARSAATTDRTPQIIDLRAAARSAGDAVHDGVVAALAARDVRIREGQLFMPRSRWGIVVLLGILTLVSIGALHGDAPRGRGLALLLVTLAISFCFVVLVVNGRPFVGDYAIKPDGLLQVIESAQR
jgi:hypothetical protein